MDIRGTGENYGTHSIYSHDYFYPTENSMILSEKSKSKYY